MIDKVQKIRDFLDGMANEDCVSTIVRKAIEKKMLPFIDSLQEEPVSSDLEDAASSFARKDSIGISNPADFYYTVADKAKIFKAGAKWQKEQMIKDAVDGKVIARYPKALPSLYDAIDIYIDNDTKLLKEGDNVKVIIIKED